MFVVSLPLVFVSECDDIGCGKDQIIRGGCPGVFVFGVGSAGVCGSNALWCLSNVWLVVMDEISIENVGVL